MHCNLVLRWLLYSKKDTKKNNGNASYQCLDYSAHLLLQSENFTCTHFVLSEKPLFQTHSVAAKSKGNASYQSRLVLAIWDDVDEGLLQAHIVHVKPEHN